MTSAHSHVTVFRSHTCGRCTRSAAGISSRPGTAFANSTKISLDRADACTVFTSFSCGLLGYVVLHTAAGPTSTQSPHQRLRVAQEQQGEATFFYLQKKSPSHAGCTLVTIGAEPFYDQITYNLPRLFSSFVFVP